MLGWETRFVVAVEWTVTTHTHSAKAAHLHIDLFSQSLDSPRIRMTHPVLPFSPFQKPTVSLQLAKKFPEFYGTRELITVLTKPFHWLVSMSHLNPVHNPHTGLPYGPVKHNLPVYTYPLIYPSNTQSYITPCRPAWIHHPHTNLSGEEHKTWGSSPCYFFPHSPEHAFTF
jgi:hypothetical protein